MAVVEGVGDHGCEYMTGGVVVVIGGTGRNFAAGMSGGIAYVLDEDGNFHKHCNMSMVGLEPIKPEPVGQSEDGGLRGLMANHLEQDAPRLYRLIERHGHYTGSARARQILDRWEFYLPKFLKVMPVDYGRSLKILAASRSREIEDKGTFKIPGVKSHG